MSEAVLLAGALDQAKRKQADQVWHVSDHLPYGKSLTSS